jgi:polysaccharide deacetylase 2 family uncharacterized protein YibQ
VPRLFSDSEIAKKIYSARTKCEAIVINVLAPNTVEKIKAELESAPFIGVATDASNHLYIKKCFRPSFNILTLNRAFVYNY